MSDITERLDYFREVIEAERDLSYGELYELSTLSAHIDPSDVLLREWAGVPEFEDEDLADCPRCEGSGFLYRNSHLGGDEVTGRECPKCEGSGALQ